MNTFSVILVAHLIADFFFQTRWMAENKSSKSHALAIHIAVYTITIGLIMFLLSDFSFYSILYWAVYNGMCHGFVDSITSKLTSWAYAEKRFGLFFNIIGIDQTIHYWFLFVTAHTLLN